MDAEKLVRIRVKGFKSIKECTVYFGNQNVLIGSNGAGKSNFISIFTFLQNILSENLQFHAAQQGISSLFYLGPKYTDAIEMAFYFGGKVGKNSYSFRLVPSDDGKLVFQGEYFGYHGGWDNENRIASGNTESMWRKGSGQYRDDYIMPILEHLSWRVYHFHDTGRTSRMKQEHNVSNCEVLMQDASNLAAFLYRLKENYEKEYKEIVRTIRLIAPFFDDFILKPQEKNSELIVLRWRQKGCEDVFNASQLSDGTLRFICLATLLLQPIELQPATIIIDEPELGLHPYAITMLAEIIHQISAEKQIIISTQSVELLNEFEPEDVIVVDRSENGSQFKRLSAQELEIWLNEDYALGDLWKMNVIGGRLS